MFISKKQDESVLTCFHWKVPVNAGNGKRETEAREILTGNARFHLIV